MLKEQEFLARYNSKFTIRNYKQVFKKFAEWRDEVPEQNLWAKDYIDYLIKQGMGNKTINYHLTVLSKYRQYLGGEKILFDRLKEKPAVTDFLTSDEIKKVLDGSKMPLRAMIRVLLDTGCRVGELEGISKQIFHSVPKEIQVTGKGLKQRVVLLSDECRDTLGRTMRDGLLFGEVITIRKAQRRLKKLGESIGLKKILHPHIFRHTFATHMLWGGADITEVKEMLGHSHLSTTERYTHITQERIKEVWEKLFQNREI